MNPSKKLAMLPALLLLVAAGYAVEPSANKILPGNQTMQEGEEFTVKKGGVFHRQPVGKAVAAVTGSDLTLTIAGKSATLPAGTQLTVARRVDGEVGKELTHAGVYCAPAKDDWNMATGLLNLATLGLFSASQRFDSETQFCLVDSEGDGQADKAFLAGAKRAADLAPIAISPTPVKVERDVPLSGISEARLRFAGAGNLLGNLVFDLEVYENGQALSFSNGREVVPKKQLPKTVSMFGASFTVLAYDPANKEARIRWNRPFPEGEYGITVTTTTTTIPIYIPG